jgi:hypothetical protein
MKTDWAASFAQWVMCRQYAASGPVFRDWHAFETEFHTRFCPHDEETSVMNKIESMAYYQGQRPVDDYIDQFEELITEAGYTEGWVIIMKFRRGLDGTLQDHIAEMGVDKPFPGGPVGWYGAAHHFEAN